MGAILVDWAGLFVRWIHVMVGIAWIPPASTWWCSTSEWIILSHNDSFMRSPAVLSHAARLPEGFADKPIFWTDDYASLFRILEY